LKAITFKPLTQKNKKDAMNKFVTSMLLSIALAFTACSKDGSVPSGEGDAIVEFSFDALTAQMTKGESVAPEDMINSLDVFVFIYETGGTNFGALEAYGFYTPGSSSYSDVLKISRGKKKVVAVANAPDGFLDDVTTYSQFQNLEWEFEHNSRDNLVMSAENVILVTGDKATVNLPLCRYVCKMEVDAITNNLPASLGDLTINGIYLDYVPRIAYSEEEFWRISDDDATEDVIDLMTGSEALTIANGETLSLSECTMYGFPNYSEEAKYVDNQDYVTKLVLKATIGGKVYYYPIGIPDTEDNNLYQISNITLTRIGNTTENKYISTTALTMNATVLDWISGEMKGSFNGTVEDGMITF